MSTALPTVATRGRPEDDDQLICIREEPGDRPDIETVDAVVKQAIEDDLVIHFPDL